MATITIKKTADSRQQQTKNGPRTIHFQEASVETTNARFKYDYEIKEPSQQLPVGTVLDWDLEADVQAGKYGPEFARTLTAIPRKTARA